MLHTRQATVNDVETIRQLAERVWWPTYAPIVGDEQVAYMLGEIYSSALISSQIIQNTQAYLLLLENGEAVAFAAYSPRPESPEIYKLHKLYCLPATQGKGYGKILINKVFEHVLAAGKNILELNVNRFNTAKSFYEKLGFSIIYEEDIPIGPYWMNDYVMQKVL